LWELLSGQRLFLGDTDFQTVKKVQQAQVPSISTINRDVPPELEKILNRALARDPAARYMTARELGQDLSRFLFVFGQPVSTFDVASLVLGTMRERQKVRAPQGSIIDKLIEEALFEFTSLKEDEKGGPEELKVAPPGARPLDPQAFIDPTNWAQEIGAGLGVSGETRRADEASIRASMHQLPEEGNLSSLEEQSPEPPPPAAPVSLRTPPPPRPVAQGAAADAAGPVLMKPVGKLEPKKASSGSSVAILLLVALLVAAGGAAAWFLKIIPHH
jgi:serine/threonine-protein kinase